jgi:acetyl-CoA carboxylase carboxyl transferase subunit beta
MAEAQGVRFTDLSRAGLVDRVVPELPDATVEPEAFCRRLGTVLQHELATLLATTDDERHAARLDRFAALGQVVEPAL